MGSSQPALPSMAGESDAVFTPEPEVAVATISAVERAEVALVKWVTPNDAGVTGSHQAGFHLPMTAWPLFFDRAGVNGENLHEDVEVDWYGHGQTSSRAHWYGRGTRSEYRLTRLGRGFPHRGEETVGSLLVIARLPGANFRAFVIEDDASIMAVLAGLGLSQADVGGLVGLALDPNDCLDAGARSLLDLHLDFPTTAEMAARARELGERCLGLTAATPDQALVGWTEVEFRLFRAFEDRDFASQVADNAVTDVNRLIELALPFTNRRKARAGRSFEHHFEACLTAADLPFSAQGRTEGANTMDFVFPSVDAYHDPSYPREQLVVCGAKTSAKERWRQVLEEADEVPTKHLLTLQPIAPSTVRQMLERGVQPVVPKPRQREFGREAKPHLWTVEQFLSHVQSTVGPQ